MKKVRFECDECQKIDEVDFSDFTCEEERSEGGMGAKVEYWSDYETTCENPKCGNDIVLKHHKTEYPVGCFEDSGFSSDGAKIL